MRKFTDIANLFITVAASASVLVIKFAPESSTASTTLKTTLTSGMTGFFVMLIALAVIAANVMVALKEIKQGGLGRHLDIASASGVSCISVQALEAQLLDGVKNEKDITDLTISLTIRGDDLPIKCDMSFKLKRQEDITGRVDELKKLVHDGFLHIIPTGVGIDVTANVVDLIADVEKRTAAVTSSGNEFSGPVYPEGDESEEA